MQRELTVLDLFSGVGGMSLGLERAGMKVVAQCEIDPFCRKVLKKHWPDVPCFEDIRELRGEDVGPVDVICGGYPCQPFSHAGQRRGAEDDRHLWPEMFRLVRELRPAWVIGENVAGHVSMGLDSVLSDLESEGYTCRPFVIPACAVDAPHRRDRVWIVAHAPHMQRNGVQHNGTAGNGQVSKSGNSRCADYVANTNSVGTHYQNAPGDMEGKFSPHCQQQRRGRTGADWGHCRWSPEPDVGRVANGVPNRVDRLRALGNAVVPQVVEQIGRAIISAHHQHTSQHSTGLNNDPVRPGGYGAGTFPHSSRPNPFESNMPISGNHVIGENTQ